MLDQGRTSRSFFSRRRVVGSAATSVAIGLAVLAVSLDRTQAGLLCGLTLVLAGALTVLIIKYGAPVRQALLREAHLLAEPTLLRGLPSRRSMTRFLAATYGLSEETVRPAAVALLAGARDDPDDGEAVVSKKTSIRYELKDHEEGSYWLTATVSEMYTRPIHDDRIVVIVTCDPDLEKQIRSGTRAQIYDFWLIYDREHFLTTVDQSFDSLEIGIRYREVLRNGEPKAREYERGLVHVPGSTVQPALWHEVVEFFDGRVDAEDYRHSLRIFEYDLRDLEEPGHELASVLAVTTRTRTMQSTDDQHCFWLATNPGLVDEIAFDVSEFGTGPLGPRFEYRIFAPLVNSTVALPSDWIRDEKLVTIPVKSLLLPGNGFALLWRPRVNRASRLGP